MNIKARFCLSLYGGKVSEGEYDGSVEYIAEQVISDCVKHNILELVVEVTVADYSYAIPESKTIFGPYDMGQLGWWKCDPWNHLTAELKNLVIKAVEKAGSVGPPCNIVRSLVLWSKNSFEHMKALKLVHSGGIPQM